MYRQNHEDRFNSSDALVLSVDGSRDSLKVIVYVNSAEYTSKPIMLVVTKIRETKATTRDAMFFAHAPVIIFIQAFIKLLRRFLTSARDMVWQFVL